MMSVDHVLQELVNAISPARRKVAAENTENEFVDWTLTGFLGRARVGTSFGDLPIEALRVRDEIRTSTGAFARVQWIDKIHLDEDFINKHPSCLPVRIPANALGSGRPMQELLVSPRQEVSVDAHAAARFMPACDLQSRLGANRVPVDRLTYYRFHCGEPVVVKVEGIWVVVRPPMSVPSRLAS